MYLPTFYKIFSERVFFNLKRYAGYGAPLALWGTWVFYPSIYNMIYTDFIPPEKGVQRRIVEE